MMTRVKTYGSALAVLVAVSALAIGFARAGESTIPQSFLPLEVPPLTPARVKAEPAAGTSARQSARAGDSAYPPIDWASLSYDKSGITGTAAAGSSFEVSFRPRAELTQAQAEYQKLKSAVPQVVGDVAWTVRELGNEGEAGHGYQLVLGPLPDGTKASQLCYALTKLAGSLCTTSALR